MILITGGARSGKSSLAERLASGVSDRVLYIATSVVTDEEMAERVKLHRQARPAHWRTWEGSQQLASVIDQQAGAGDAVILECITTLIANLMFDLTGEMPVESIDFAVVETAIQRQIDDLLTACARSSAAIYLVTNELGMGIVPENRLARHFRDIAGRVNQRLAAAAESVLLVISGIEVKIK
ncbi:TPA: bifunctional adenosylcobinamide kinase/adenosylcobinamide-phosphate guanylyltransferase [Serratia fonticola]